MIDPIDEDLAELLRDAKTIAAPEAAKARVLQRVAASLPPPGGGSPDAPPAPPPVSPAAAAAGGTVGFPAWSVAAALAVGLGLGYAGAQLAPARERVTYIERPAPVSAVIPAELVSGGAAPGLRPEDLPRVPGGASNATTAAAATATATARGEDLAKERAVLDVARSALGRGDAANTLVAIAEHEHKYPQGALTEEREALAIQALAMQGRRTDAQARAGRFQKRFPKSMLLPAIAAVTGEGPDTRERDP
jgi:hypothetical protein